MDTVEVVVYEQGTCVAITAVELTLLTTSDVYPGEQVEFSADLTPDDATLPYTYTLDYGDGTAPVSGSNSADPFSFNYTYTYTGDYTVEFWVWNCETSALVSDTIAVTVSEPVYMIYLPVVIKND